MDTKNPTTIQAILYNIKKQNENQGNIILRNNPVGIGEIPSNFYKNCEPSWKLVWT